MSCEVSQWCQSYVWTYYTQWVQKLHLDCLKVDLLVPSNRKDLGFG